MKAGVLPFRRAFVVSGVALALFGLVRFTFATVGVRIFGPGYLADTAPSYAAVTIVAALISAVPGVVVSKFVPELLAREDGQEAERLFSAMLAVVVLGAVASAVGFVLLGPPRFNGMFATLSLCFPLYAMFKLTYLAFGASPQYAGAEVASCATFLFTFGAACLAGSERLATASLVVHPAVFVVVAAVHHRRFYRGTGAIRHLRQKAGEYVSFSGFTLLNAATGMGGTPLVLVIAGMVLPNRIDVGYLSALLIGITPLNLLPSALGSVLFPEIARRHGLKDPAGIRRLVWRSTALLQVVSGVALGILALFPEVALALLGVPNSDVYARTWAIVAFGMFLGAAGLPSGMLLNATTAVRLNALIGSLWLVVALLAGPVAIRVLGVVGAGMMFFLATGPPGWWRMAVSTKETGWLEGNGRPIVLSQIAIVLAFLIGMTHSSPFASTFVVGLLIAMQVPLARAVARQESPYGNDRSAKAAGREAGELEE